jgi:hypothetical protein
VIDPDQFSRTEKLFVDRDGKTFSEARAELGSHALQLDIGPNWTELPGATAAILTAVNSGSRAFGGGVLVRLRRDGIITGGWSRGFSLSEAVVRHGGSLVDCHGTDHMTVTFGLVDSPVGRLVLHATWSGWSGGVVTHTTERLDGDCGNPLTGALAGGIAVSECFQNAFHGPVPGRRNSGISLWQPGSPWRLMPEAHPKFRFLPDSLWIAGLGHLGQAYLWVLGLLEYPFDSHPSLILQDFDRIGAANLQTSLLARKQDCGLRKTQVALDRLRPIGFDCGLIDRRFDETTKGQEGEPQTILSGFDNYAARRLLGDAGFARTVDAGLGSGYDRYLNILVRSFDGAFDGSEVWTDLESRQASTVEALGDGYQREIQEQVANGTSAGDAGCGMIEVAGKAVGASFVGAVAACLVIADLIRPLHGGPIYRVVSADLGSMAVEATNPTKSRSAERSPFIDAFKTVN